MEFNHIDIDKVREIYPTIVIFDRLTQSFELDEDRFWVFLCEQLKELLIGILDAHDSPSEDIVLFELQYAFDVVSSEDDMVGMVGKCPFKRGWIFKLAEVLEDITVDM